MAKKIIFSDQVAQYPNRYIIDGLGGDLYQITLSPGTVSTPGTPLSASNLNAMADEAIFKLKDTSTSSTAYTTDIANLSTYYEGLTIMFKPANTNTGTSTINISGVGAAAIKKTDNSGNIVNLQANDLIKNKYSTMTYDGTEFLMNNPSADLAETIADISAIESRLDTDETSIANIKTETIKFAILQGGTSNAYAATIPTVTSYTSGLNVDIVPNVSNTGASTLKINELDAKNITYNGSNIVSGFLQQNKIYRTVYNGVSFEIQPSSSFTPANNGQVQTNLIAEQATKLQTARNIALSGDITGNADFKGDSNVTLSTTLKDSGVTSGIYKSVTVDSKGRVTAGTNPTTRDGYGLTDVYTKSEADSAISTGANNAVTGVITVDFAGKVSGSVVENPNICRALNNNSLLAPTILGNGGSGFIEVGQGDYNEIKDLNNIAAGVIATTTANSIPQQLFAFNIIANVEKKYGTIPGSTTADKVAWLKNNIDSITCNWWGYGSCPSGNKATVSRWSNISSAWMAQGVFITTSSPSLMTLTPNLSNSIDINGFIYFLAYTDASDGITPSVINTDYVSLEITFKNIFGALLIGENQAKTDLNTHIADNSKHIPHLGTTTNAGNAYSITTTEAINANQKFTIDFNTVSTSNPTLSINGGTAHAILKPNGNNAKLYASIYMLFWDGSAFILLGEGGEYGTALASDVRSTKTIGTEDNGVIQGTLDLSNLVSANLKAGITIDGVTGKSSVVDTADATALTADKIVNGYSAYANGNKINGSATIESLGGKKCISNYATNISQHFTVSGLNFTPSQISFTNIDGNYSAENYFNISQHNKGFYIQNGSGTMSDNNITINSDGFTVNNILYGPNTVAFWIAIE